MSDAHRALLYEVANKEEEAWWDRLEGILGTVWTHDQVMAFSENNKHNNQKGPVRGRTVRDKYNFPLSVLLNDRALKVVEAAVGPSTPTVKEDYLPAGVKAKDVVEIATMSSEEARKLAHERNARIRAEKAAAAAAAAKKDAVPEKLPTKVHDK